jgi:hypothetical protein
MVKENDIKVGTILDNGDTVFHVTESDYWVLAPQSLWKECTWEEGIEYCKSIGYDLPNAKDLQLIYTSRPHIDAVDASGGATLSAIQSGTAPGSTTTNVCSSPEYDSVSAWCLHFDHGNWYYNLKFNSNWVVPFRKVQKQIKLQGQVVHPVDR